MITTRKNIAQQQNQQQNLNDDVQVRLSAYYRRTSPAVMI